MYNAIAPGHSSSVHPFSAFVDEERAAAATERLLVLGSNPEIGLG